MANIVPKCPSCQEDMKVASLVCSTCGIKIEGSFSLPAILNLAAEDQEFVMNFFKVQGAIKDMEKIYGVSYPTIKNRWAQIAKALGMDVAHRPAQSKMQVLEALGRGELTPEEAVERLKETR